MAVSDGIFGRAKRSANGQRRAPAPEFLRLAAPAGQDSGQRTSGVLAAPCVTIFSP